MRAVRQNTMRMTVPKFMMRRALRKIRMAAVTKMRMRSRTTRVAAVAKKTKKSQRRIHNDARVQRKNRVL